MHSSRTPTRRARTAAQWGGVVAAGMLTVSGCGLLRSENTAETTAPPPPPPAPPTTSAPAPLPPRPFEMNMAGVDPCDLLTEQQRGQLGFDREPLADAEAGFGDAPTCSFRNTTAKVGARLSLITTESMDVWTDDTAQVQATPVVLGGFPALVIKTPDLDMACNVAVDVAAGQHLDVLYRDDGGQPAPPLDALCAGAQRVAENAVASLADPAPPTSEETSTSESSSGEATTSQAPTTPRPTD
ncbi:MAG: DUF3558 domain-containing protein [Saccharopolyspora sp.]|uniref:DUF3558 domain-containing protein n=1 Tax=Saccharopolyspora TaxID=1835 RepID=UPI00190CC86A|nr:MULTISPECIES: DUF3558 domain-containing protein [unclassified Saccharopolyspora]MBK0870713.1 DUF3558 domain-containing protein [Saccharopolyspora sp. HNM0986]MBQ6640255.1 DUF3558 domain-containing protein [Saccharopolyspora sp.]